MVTRRGSPVDLQHPKHPQHGRGLGTGATMWKIHAGAGRGRTEAVRLAAVAVAASAALAGCGAVENQTADQSAGAQ
jgi:hypothetical protein